MIKDPDKRKKYHREWIKKRRDAWIKENGPCKECGSSESLEVDHIDPKTKEFNPKNIWSRTKKIRDLELEKCQVLCKKCHRRKSNIELSTAPKHGLTAYYNGCKCDICRAANAQKRAAWRLKTGRH